MGAGSNEGGRIVVVKNPEDCHSHQPSAVNWNPFLCETCTERSPGGWTLGAVGGIRMGWVNDARRELAAGRQVQVRPFGGSILRPPTTEDVVEADVAAALGPPGARLGKGHRPHTGPL